MPVNEKQTKGEVLYQRELYSKGGASRLYWDYKDQQILKWISTNDKKIVDLGCGEGILLEKVVNAFPNSEVVGIDIIPENVEICQKNNLNVFLDDLYHPKIGENSVDVALLIEVIEHLEKPDIVIKDIYRILKHGGKVIVLFPNDFTFAAYRFFLLKFKEFFYDTGHVEQFTFKKLEQVFKPALFESIYNQSVPFYFWQISLHGLMVFRKR